MRVIFTGGHHNSALEVAKHLKRVRPKVQLLWLGHKHSMLGDSSLSAEYQEVSRAGIEFREIKAGKLYKTFHPLHWLRLPYGFLQSLYYVSRFRPNLIVSFGGYLAAPVVLAGWLWRVPIVTHEQTTVVGLANRFIAHFANKIFITWPQSKRYFDPRKTVLTGLPLRKTIFENKGRFRFNNSLPTVYITGGKQGSHVLNRATLEIVEDLLSEANLIHQTGASKTTNDYQKARDKRENLDTQLRERYLIKDYFFEDQIGDVYSVADLVISRAGAHTIYELAALGKPALLVPIPWASHNEQYKNARILINEGIARILPEDHLSPATLLEEIKFMLKNLEKYQQSAPRVRQLVTLNATERITQAILELLDLHSN